MPPIELRKTIEDKFNRWDAEFKEREQGFLDTQDLKERLKQEKEQINRSLDETVAKFDELLNLLDKEHVIFPSGENLNECNYQKIVELSRVIYEEAMLALHLTRDHDFLEHPELRVLKDSPELNKFIPLPSLKKKVKAHFILAELYAALGVRLDTELDDKSAIKEYKTVIDEGKILFKRLQKEGNGQLENSLVGAAYNVGASYKRLFDLFVEAEKKDKERYGKVTITKGERSVLHDYVKESREWYNDMFDIAHKKTKTLDLNKVFNTEYEFKSYLNDINGLNVGCIFQSCVGDNFECSKEGEDCKFIPKKDDHPECKAEKDITCGYLKNTPYHGGLMIRLEFIRY